MSGAVVLHAIISKTGTIENLGVVSGDPMLREAAVNAVRKWTYKPYLLNGQPTEVDTTITVNFQLAANDPTNRTSGPGGMNAHQSGPGVGPN